MTAQLKIKRAIELLAEAQAELNGQTRETGGPNLECVAEFLITATVTGDKTKAQLCWQRFAKWLPCNEWSHRNRNQFYDRLRVLGYRVAPGTNNKLMIHSIALKEKHDTP